MIEQKQNNSSEDCKVKIYTFGQFKIKLRNGELYNASGRSNKLWNIYKFLLVNNDKDIPQEIILEYLYPDEIYEDPQNAVHNMIYRLRKLLISEKIFLDSKNVISFSNGCYKLKVRDEAYLDFDIFDEYIRNAEKIEKEDPVKAIELYKTALELYNGEFLPELVNENWVIPKRTYLSKLYLKSVINLSELYKGQNAYDMIVKTCQKALVYEPYEEEIHMCLVENLLKMGKYREAKNHYEETVKFFEKQYGIRPTSEMQKIGQMLNTEYIDVKNRNSNPSLRLINEGENKGAFYCEYRDFYAIYALEKRRCERSGDAICPVSIEIDNKKNIFKTDSYKKTVVNEFKKTLLNSLRRGDTFTLINKTKFLVLLPNIEYDKVRLVMDRVIKKFMSNDTFKDINIETEACPLLPQKVK